MHIDRDATLKAAEKLLRQGRLDAAIAEYVRLVTAHPNDWSSVNALGDLYVRAGQTDRAVTQFARVAEHLAREGALARAAAVYKKILRISPADARAARGLAVVTEKQEARSARRGPAVIAPEDADARMLAAREAQDAGDVARACTLLLEAAALYETQGRPSDAVAAIAEASGIEPANNELRNRLLQMLIAQGELVQARHLARVVPEMLVVAEAFERLGRRDEALDTVVEAAVFDPENGVLRERVLRQLVDAGEIDRARRVARSPADLLIIAEVLNRQSRGSEVVEVVAEAVEREPQNVALREQLVSSCLDAGDLARARQSARSSRDWMLLAEALRREDRHVEALAAMHEATQRDPHDAGLHAEFVRACIAAGNIGQARQEARTKAEIVQVADALESSGDAAGALQMRADALRRDPDDPELRLRLIRDYIRTGDRDRAHALLTIDVAGEDAELITLLARLEFGIGRLEEGRRALNHLLAVHGDRRGDLLALGRDLAEAGQHDAAFACVDIFADAAAASGEWQAGVAALQQVLAGSPRHIPALMKTIEIAVDGGLHDTMTAAQGQLADAYLAAGKADDARIIAEDLVLRAPWERASVERALRALALCDDPDPERTIADLLTTESSLAFEDL